MPQHFDLLIRNGTCVLPWGLEQTDIGVIDGRIAAIGASLQADAEKTLDAKHLTVLPGLIDSHVHLRDPGDASVESIASGTRAAVLGGITTVFDMPNTSPPIIDAESLALKQKHVEQTAFCDMGLYIGATKTNIDALGGLERAHGVCAVKVFMGSSTGSLLVEDDASLEAVLAGGARRVAFHSEDEYRLKARRALFRTGDAYANHMLWRDEETAFLGTRRLLVLARKTNRPVHILHVSTAEELTYVAAYRDLATVEVLVNHLTQIAPECYEQLGGYAVMNPPIRGPRHWQAAWQAIANGTVDTVASDHAPHPKAAKERPWPDCAAGVTGVQTLVPVMLTHVHAGRLSLLRLVDLLAAGPARVFGLLRKGRIAVGYDADFTLVDLKHSRRIEESWIASPCGWSPFVGMQVHGWPVASLVRGRVVMQDDEVIGPPCGRLALFR